MSLIPFNDVNYKIICFSCVTKNTFIDNNAKVANNIYKKCIKYFKDTFATRKCLIPLGKLLYYDYSNFYLREKALQFSKKFC